MTSGSFQNVIKKMCLQIIYLYKNQPNQIYNFQKRPTRLIDRTKNQSKLEWT